MVRGVDGSCLASREARSEEKEEKYIDFKGETNFK